MNIVAAYDKTLFYNEASKYCVLRLKTADPMVPENARDKYRFADHLIRFVAVGYDLPRTGAIKMELDGEWADGKYGPQLQVNGWHELVPPTIEGVLGYLSSGLLKGIGPKTAEAIVQRFGTDSLDVIEHYPEKLLEIKGITGEKQEEIKAGYAESKAVRDLMTVLAPFKLTPKTAMKIYEHFGPDGAALLRKSFYQLCQIPGFGFKKVDAIVIKSGGNLHDPMRVQGALFYAIEKSRTEGGHLYMEAEKLLGEGLALLNEKIPQLEQRLQRPQLERELRTMVMTNVVVSKKGNIYLPHVFNQESETARKVVEMLLERPEPVLLGPVMERIKGKLGITLSPRQYEGVEMAFRHNLSIITGGPGTGKSTILKAVIEAYQVLYPGKTVALGAPTGKASRRMAETTGMGNAATLHSLLGLQGEDAGWQEKKELEADFLIVDEASMVDMWLAHQMFVRLKKGTKLLIVGDADQLESVGAGSVFRELIQSGLVPVTVLDQIFRQAEDSLIAYNAKFIKEGTGQLYYGRDFAFTEALSQEETAALIRGLYRGALRHTAMEQVQILTPFRATGDASANSLNAAIQAEINPPAAGNPNVSRGASKVHQLAVKNGLRCRRLVWNPNYKGIDDWQLALRRKKATKKERERMNFKEMYLNGMCPFGYIDSCADQWRSRPDIGAGAEEFLGLTHEEYQMYLQMDPAASLKECLDSQRRTQKFRVYQLNSLGVEAHPVAFRSMEIMLKAGYRQPPAGSYRLVYDGELTHPRDMGDKAVLRRIYDGCNDDLPEGYQGRSMTMSDIVELYDGDNRDFYYCDEDGFTPVRFDAEQAAPMREADGDE